jgi:hypothetical protein
MSVWCRYSIAPGDTNKNMSKGSGTSCLRWMGTDANVYAMHVRWTCRAGSGQVVRQESFFLQDMQNMVTADANRCYLEEPNRIVE